MKSVIGGLAGALFAFAVLSVNADTINKTIGSAGGSYPAALAADVVKLERTLDLSETTVTTNDVVQLLSISSNSFVLAAGLEVVIASTNAILWDLGDGVDADGYVADAAGTNLALHASVPFSASVTVAATGSATSVSFSPGYGRGKLYSANDTIDGSFTGAAGAHTGKIRAWAIVQHIGP